jgi:hypothetical protein
MLQKMMAALFICYVNSMALAHPVVPPRLAIVPHRRVAM